MAAPNLDDPVEAAAYRDELAGVARGMRLVGLWITVAGALLVALVRGGRLPLPMWAPVIVVGAGVMLMISAFAARAQYHRLRMREG